MSKLASTQVTLQTSADGLTWADTETWILPTNSPAYIDYDNTSNYVRVIATADTEVAMTLEV